jgi:predicted transcriptional regulator YdeE
MHVIGLTLHTSFNDGRNKTEIPPFFHKVLEEGLLDRVPDRLNANQLCVFKMERNNPDFDYTMGVEVSKADGLPESMALIRLPAAKYVTVKNCKTRAGRCRKGF